MKRLFAALFLKEVPEVNEFIKWLFDPATRAKKRTLIVFLVSFAGGLKASVPLIGYVCNGVDNFVCRVDYDAVAVLVSRLSDLLNTPEAGGVAFLTGLYAIFHGFHTDKKAKNS